MDCTTGPIGAIMLSHVVGHLRRNIVGYAALFVALGGTSYAAATLAPGSVTTRTLANGAVTNSKLARNSVGTADLRDRSLTAADFKAGVLAQAAQGGAGANGASGADGKSGAAGPAGPAGPAGKDGSASVVMTARQNGGSVTAPAGQSTTVPLTGASWTQAANDLNLITGSMQVGTPGSCTGSFGNSLTVNVDGKATTFGVAPTTPASTTETVPFEVSELMEPGAATPHTITATLSNACTKAGENYTISNVKIDVVNFH